jgi:hypothetical protein
MFKKNDMPGARTCQGLERLEPLSSPKKDKETLINQIKEEKKNEKKYT